MPGCEPEGRTPQTSPTTATSAAQSEQALAHGSPPAPQQGAWAFRSRQDLSPPAARVDTQAHDTAPGYIFIAPERGGPSQGGPMIVDDRGQVVWFRPVRDESTFARDLKVQNYRGEPVLTWWEGFLGGQHNEYVILDSSYRELTRFRAGVLPNGNVFIGWGRALAFSEVSGDGELLFDASLPPKNNSYRAFRFPWDGHPNDEPAAVAERVSEAEVKIYVSWNGATQVAAWEVLSGPGPGRLKSLGRVRRNGFETAITVHTGEPYVAVQAKHGSGHVLGTSEALEPRS
jgi:hypothetical protein